MLFFVDFSIFITERLLETVEYVKNNLLDFLEGSVASPKLTAAAVSYCLFAQQYDLII